METFRIMYKLSGFAKFQVSPLFLVENTPPPCCNKTKKPSAYRININATLFQMICSLHNSCHPMYTTCSKARMPNTSVEDHEDVQYRQDLPSLLMTMYRKPHDLYKRGYAVQMRHITIEMRMFSTSETYHQVS